ncbi:hypothetical protein SCATT_32030 [Streptantibioticus cattleyicolor NRRL 8057 = DSM 46488]|uniref:Uncharacterized protein n=1 Tax=Streptantibioticus cattleyicolor (strain ATCC 35852 / DSM 46488 / JCM 4925 / NBRC 14057 / NRRL 8057) TaxID=1003195 RepID=G8WZX3_STREN|nr:hypothetical protein SCATT_32030 [Streptantibioticus cattleyicolor NRRL 8057 = DSM 46488]
MDGERVVLLRLRYARTARYLYAFVRTGALPEGRHSKHKGSHRFTRSP